MTRSIVPNNIVIDGDVARILLHPAGCGDVAIIDAADYSLVSRFSWRARSPGGQYTKYAMAHPQHHNNRGWVRMHRIIMGLIKGDSRRVDHIDGDGLNNRRSNLRIATSSENGQNQRKKSRAHSRFKGVSRGNSKSTPWRAYIKAGDRFLSLGYFVSEVEAAAAYNRAALEHFGEFACLNDLGTPER